MIKSQWDGRLTEYPSDQSCLPHASQVSMTQISREKTKKSKWMSHHSPCQQQTKMLPLIAVQEQHTVLSNPVFRIRVHWVRIRIQHFRLNTDPDPGFWWLDIEKIYSWKKNLIYFLIKSCNLLIFGLHKVLARYIIKPLALKREHPALRIMKVLFFIFFYFCGSFSPSWIRIQITNRDQLTWLKQDPKHCSDLMWELEGDGGIEKDLLHNCLKVPGRVRAPEAKHRK